MRKASLKDKLKGILPDNMIEQVNRSFEVVGSIAILEISEDLKEYEKEIAQGVMEVNASIKTVLKKSGIHEGEFRTQRMEYLLGEETKETEYLENGVKLLLDVEQVYFSSKLGTERLELSQQVKEGNRVLVMFSGCGPYTFNILRKQPNIKLIDSIEINPQGHEYALKNLHNNRNLLKKSREFKEIVEKKKENGDYISERTIVDELNKKKIRFYCGDVKTVVEQELKGSTYDEIFMPLPKDAYHFLDVALQVADTGCLIHMYDFVHENDFPQESEEKVHKAAQELGKKIKILQTRKVGQYSPRKYRVCCDFTVSN